MIRAVLLAAALGVVPGVVGVIPLPPMNDLGPLTQDAIEVLAYMKYVVIGSYACAIGRFLMVRRTGLGRQPPEL